MSDENILPNLAPDDKSNNNPPNDGSPVRSLSKQFQVLSIGRIVEESKSKKHNFLISPLQSIENVNPQTESVQSDSLGNVFSPLLSTVENIGAECDIFESVSNVANDLKSEIDAFFSNPNGEFDALKNPFDNYFSVASSNRCSPYSCRDFFPTAETTESTTQCVTCEKTAGQLLLKIATPYKTKTVPVRGLDSEETDFEKKRDILMQSDKKLYKPKEDEGKTRKGRSLMAFMDDAFNDEKTDSTNEKSTIEISLQTNKDGNRSTAETNVQELCSVFKDESTGVGESTAFSLMNDTNLWDPEAEFKFGISDSIEDAFEMPAKRIRAETSGKTEKSAERKTQKIRPRRKSSIVAPMDTISKKQVTFASSDQIIDRSTTSEDEHSRDEHGLNLTPESVGVPLAEAQNIDFKNDDVTLQNPSTSTHYETYSWRSETVERDDISVMDSDAEDFFSLDSTNIETEEDVFDFNHTIPTPLILKTQLLKLENASLNNSCASPLSSLSHMSSNVSSPLDHANDTVVPSMSDDDFSDDFESVKSYLSVEENLENQIPSDCSTILEATFDEHLAPIQTTNFSSSTEQGEILGLTRRDLEVTSNVDGANSDDIGPEVSEHEEAQMDDFVNISSTCSTFNGSSSTESNESAIINEYNFVSGIASEDESINLEDSSCEKEDGTFEVVFPDQETRNTDSDFPKLILTRVDQNMISGSSLKVKGSEFVNKTDERNVSAVVPDETLEIRPMDVEEIDLESFANDTSMNATAIFTNSTNRTSPVESSHLQSAVHQLDSPDKPGYVSVPVVEELHGSKNNFLNSSFENTSRSQNTSFTSPNICEKPQKIEIDGTKLVDSLESIPIDSLMNFSSSQISPIEMCHAVYDGNESSFSDVLNKTRLNSSNTIPADTEGEIVDTPIAEKTFNRENDEMIVHGQKNAVKNELCQYLVASNDGVSCKNVSEDGPIEVTNSINDNIVNETFQIESCHKMSPAPPVPKICLTGNQNVVNSLPSDADPLKFLCNYRKGITSGLFSDILEETFPLDCHETMSMDVEEDTPKIVSDNTSMNLTRIMAGNLDQISPTQTSGAEIESDSSPVEVQFGIEKKVNDMTIDDASSIDSNAVKATKSTSVIENEITNKNEESSFENCFQAINAQGIRKISVCRRILEIVPPYSESSSKKNNSESIKIEVTTNEEISESVDYTKREEILQTFSDTENETSGLINVKERNLNSVVDETWVNVTREVSGIAPQTIDTVVDETWVNVTVEASGIVQQTLPNSPDTVHTEVEEGAFDVEESSTDDKSSLVVDPNIGEDTSNEVRENNVEKSDPEILAHSVSIHSREVFNRTCHPIQEDELGPVLTASIKTAEKVINILTDDKTFNVIKDETNLSVTIPGINETMEDKEPNVCAEKCDNRIIPGEGSFNITTILDRTRQISPDHFEASKEDIQNKIDGTVERTPETVSTACEETFMRETNEACKMDAEALNGTFSITPVSPGNENVWDGQPHVVEIPGVWSGVCRAFGPKKAEDIELNMTENVQSAVSTSHESSGDSKKPPGNENIWDGERHVIEIPCVWRGVSRSFSPKKAEDMEPSMIEIQPCTTSTNHGTSDESGKHSSYPTKFDEPLVILIPEVTGGPSRSLDTKEGVDIEPKLNENIPSLMTINHQTTGDSEKPASNENIWDGEHHVVEIPGVWSGVCRAFGPKKAVDIEPSVTEDVQSATSTNHESSGDSEKPPSNENIWDGEPHVVEIPGAWKGISRSFSPKKAEDIEPSVIENVQSVMSTSHESSGVSEKPASNENIWNGEPDVVEIPGVWRGVCGAFGPKKAEDIEPSLTENAQCATSTNHESSGDSEKPPNNENIWDGQPHVIGMPGVWTGISRSFSPKKAEDIDPSVTKNVQGAISTNHESPGLSEKPASNENIWDGEPHVVEIPGVWSGVCRAFGPKKAVDIEPSVTENVQSATSTNHESSGVSEKPASNENIWDGEPHVVEIPGVWSGVCRAFGPKKAVDIEPRVTENVQRTDNESSGDSEKPPSIQNIWDGEPHVVEIPGAWKGISQSFSPKKAVDIEQSVTENVQSATSTSHESSGDSEKPPSNENIWDGEPHVVEIPGVWSGVCRAFGPKKAVDIEPSVTEDVQSATSTSHESSGDSEKPPSNENIWDGEPHVVEIPGAWKGMSIAFSPKKAEDIDPSVTKNVQGAISTSHESSGVAEKPAINENIWDGEPHVVEIPGVWRGVCRALGPKKAEDIEPNMTETTSCLMNTNYESVPESHEATSCLNILNKTQILNSSREYEGVSASISTTKDEDIEPNAHETVSWATNTTGAGPYREVGLGPGGKPTIVLLPSSNRISRSPLPESPPGNLSVVNETQVSNTPVKCGGALTLFPTMKERDIEPNLDETASCAMNTTNNTSTTISVRPRIKIDRTTPSKETATPLLHRSSRLSSGTPMSLGDKFAIAEKIRENLDKLLTPFRKNLDRLRGPMDVSSNNLTLIDHATPMPLFAFEECEDGDKTRFVVEMPANLLDISVSALDDLLTVPQSANDGPSTHDVFSNITTDVSLSVREDPNLENLKKQSEEDKKKIDELIDMNEKLLSICSNLSTNEAELKRVFHEAEDNLRIQMNKYEMMKDYNNRYICEMNDEFDTLETEMKSSKEKCRNLELELKLSKEKYENLEVELKSSKEKCASLETELKSSKRSSENTRKKR